MSSESVRITGDHPGLIWTAVREVLTAGRQAKPDNTPPVREAEAAPESAPQSQAAD